MGNSLNDNRKYYVDLLKTMAIFGVMVIHVWSIGNYEIGSDYYFMSLIWGSITHSSVPIFLMVSGMLMLDPKKKVPISRLYFHNILRIVIALAVWTIAYKVYHYYVPEVLGGTTLAAQAVEENGGVALTFWQNVGEILKQDDEFHLYFMYIILLVYLFLPVTRIVTAKASRSGLEYFLILWFILGIVYPTVTIYKPFDEVEGILEQWQINMTYAAIGYTVLGYYLSKYPISKITSVILVLLGFAITFLGTYSLSLENETVDMHYIEGMTVGTACIASGICGFVVSISNDKLSKLRYITTPFSKSALCIYMCHLIVLYVLNLYGMLDVFNSWAPIASIPVISLILMVLSFVVYLVLSCIPVLRKVII